MRVLGTDFMQFSGWWSLEMEVLFGVSGFLVDIGYNLAILIFDEDVLIL